MGWVGLGWGGAMDTYPSPLARCLSCGATQTRAERRRCAPATTPWTNVALQGPVAMTLHDMGHTTGHAGHSTSTRSTGQSGPVPACFLRIAVPTSGSVFASTERRMGRLVPRVDLTVVTSHPNSPFQPPLSPVLLHRRPSATLVFKLTYGPSGAQVHIKLRRLPTLGTSFGSRLQKLKEVAEPYPHSTTSTSRVPSRRTDQTYVIPCRPSYNKSPFPP